MDGSFKSCGSGSSAVLWASYQRPSPQWIDAEWELVASVALQVDAQSVVQTELVAAVLAYVLVEAYIMGKRLGNLQEFHGQCAMIAAHRLILRFVS